MESYKKLLLANRAWAHEKAELKPDFFESLAKGQKPDFLWIGCSDSRVPAEEVTGAEPGEIFVHRNISNLVVHSDFNIQSVLQYAVDYLEVKHIIVCGHYGCGGVKAAISKGDFGVMNKWLFYVKETYSKHAKELDALSEDARMNRLIELNVEEQVSNIAKTALVQRSWKRRKGPLLHGWVFGLNDGLLKEQIVIGPDSPMQHIFEFKPE